MSPALWSSGTDFLLGGVEPQIQPLFSSHNSCLLVTCLGLESSQPTSLLYLSGLLSSTRTEGSRHSARSLGRLPGGLDFVDPEACALLDTFK